MGKKAIKLIGVCIVCIALIWGIVSLVKYLSN